MWDPDDTPTALEGHRNEEECLSAEDCDIDGSSDDSCIWHDTTTPVDASAEHSYIWDVSSAVLASNGDAAIPSGTYYVYYFFSTDGTFSDNEYPYQADGTLTISSSDDIDSHFELTPNTATVSKDDIITLSVMAQDDSYFSEIVSLSISVDNTYFEVQNSGSPFSVEPIGHCNNADSDGDGDDNTGEYVPGGNQPETEALCLDPASDGAEGGGGDGDDDAGTWTIDSFWGTVTTNEVVTNTITDELRWVSWVDGGMDSDGDGIGHEPIEIAKFSLKVLQDGDSSADTLMSKSISFNTSGEFATGIVANDNNIIDIMLI